MLGAYRSVRGGHRLNALVLQALFADTEAWTDGAGSLGARGVPVDMAFAVAAGESTTPLDRT